jgi:hypothetical protein
MVLLALILCIVLRIFGIFLGVLCLLYPCYRTMVEERSDHMDVVFIYLAIKCCCWREERESCCTVPLCC